MAKRIPGGGRGRSCSGCSLWLLVYSTPPNVRTEVAEPPIPVSEASADALGPHVYGIQDLQRPGLVLLHFLVPAIPEERARIRPCVHRQVRLDSVPHGGCGQSAWRRVSLPPCCTVGFRVARARKIAVLFFAALMTSAIPAVLVSNVFVSIALISTATLGYTGALSNMLAMPADRFPKNTVGSVWGIASMGAGFGGMVFSLATGWVVDHYSYVPVFIGFGILPLIAAAIVWSLPDAAGSGPSFFQPGTVHSNPKSAPRALGRLRSLIPRIPITASPTSGGDASSPPPPGGPPTA